MLKKENIPTSTCVDKTQEFLHLKQGNMIVIEYSSIFTRLALYATSMIQDDELKARLFEDGFRDEIRRGINIV